MQSKNRILQSAEALFFQKGYRQTTTKEIATDASVSEALLFKYFKNKEGLMQAVVHRTLKFYEKASQNMIDEILISEELPRKKLELLVANRYHFFMNHFKEVAIIIRQMQFDPSMKSKVTNILQEKIDPVLTQVLTTWFQSIGKPYNPVALAMVKGILFDTMLQRALLNSPPSLEDVLIHLDVILKGLTYD